MADTGWVICTAGEDLNDASSSDVWTSVSNITTDDGNHASFFHNKGSGVDTLKAYTYALSVPSGATIDGIEVRVEGNEVGQGGTIEEVNIGIDDSTLGTKKTPGENLVNNDTIFDYGGATDLWGLTPDDTDVNDAQFQVRWLFGLDVGDGLEVDYCAIKVYYTESSNEEAVGTITATGTAVAKARHTAITAVSTSTGDIVSTATAFKFALGTITITGDLVSVGTHAVSATITMLGEGLSEGRHDAFAVTSFIGELTGAGGLHLQTGTSTAIGTLVATAVSLVPASATITATGTLISTGLHGNITATSTFIGELIAAGQSLGGIQTALGTITVFGENTSDGIHRAFASSTFIGDVAAVGFDISAIEAAGIITLIGNVAGNGRTGGFAVSTSSGDLAALGYSQNDAAATSTLIGQIVSRGTSNASGTITMLGTGLSEGIHLAKGTVTATGQMDVGGGQHIAAAVSTVIGEVISVGSGLKFPTATITLTGTLSSTHKSLIFGTSTAIGTVIAAGFSQVDALGTTTFIGDVASIGVNTSQQGAVGTITYSGEVAASGTHLAGGTSTISGQVAAAGVTLTRFAAATITVFGVNSSVGSKLGVGTINVAGDLAAIGSPLVRGFGVCLFRGDLEAFPTNFCPIPVSGSILLTGNIRTADMFISNHRDGTLGVKPHKVSFDSIFGSLSAPALYHYSEDGDFLAKATITAKGALSAIIIKASCIAPKVSINLTSFMHANDGVFVLGTRIARGTVGLIGDMPTTSASLPHAGLNNITSFMSAHGRVVPEGDMALVSLRADVNLSGRIGPATIDGQKQALISTSFGSLELYNNSQGAFYSIGGAGTIKEAFTLLTMAGDISARGRKDQTQFGIGNIVMVGLVVDDGADPKGIHINNLSTIGLSGTVGAHGSILGIGEIIPTGQMVVGGGSHIQRATSSFIGQVTALATHFKFGRGTTRFIGQMVVGGGTHFTDATIATAGTLVVDGTSLPLLATATITATGTAAAIGTQFNTFSPTFNGAQSPTSICSGDADYEYADFGSGNSTAHGEADIWAVNSASNSQVKRQGFETGADIDQGSNASALQTLFDLNVRADTVRIRLVSGNFTDSDHTNYPSTSPKIGTFTDDADFNPANSVNVGYKADSDVDSETPPGNPPGESENGLMVNIIEFTFKKATYIDLVVTYKATSSARSSSEDTS